MIATAEEQRGGTGSMRLIYGERPRRLSAEEARHAPFDRRCESVWPFVVRKVSEFLDRTMPSDRPGLEMDDVLCEIWISLRTKDDRWDPDQGRYITFAWAVAWRRMAELRDRARVVASPPNCYSTITKYQDQADELSEKRRVTLQAMKATRWSYVPVDHESPITDDREGSCVLDEARTQIAAALATLSPYEAAILGRTSGLFGQKSSLTAVAKKLKIRRDVAGRIRDEAMRKLAEILRAKREDSYGD